MSAPAIFRISSDPLLSCPVSLFPPFPLWLCSNYFQNHSILSPSPFLFVPYQIFLLISLPLLSLNFLVGFPFFLYPSQACYFPFLLCVWWRYSCSLSVLLSWPSFPDNQPSALKVSHIPVSCFRLPFVCFGIRQVHSQDLSVHSPALAHFHSILCICFLSFPDRFWSCPNPLSLLSSDSI